VTGPSPPPESATARSGRGASAVTPVWAEALAIFAVALVVVFVAVWVGARGHFATYGGVDTAPYPGSGLFGGWFRFDGNWYALIATKGYWFSGPSVQSPVAYFPGYPGLLWALHGISGVSVKLLGSLVTIACGAAASVGVLRWFRDRVTDRVARLALITLLVYPYAFYLMGAVYGDALFLLASVCAFLLLERDHPVLAGLAGALATATRPVGIALVVGLIAVALWRRHVIARDEGRVRVHWRRLHPSDAGVLLSLGGLVGYMTWLGIRFGHPLAFDEVQRAQGWDQGSGPRTWLKITWFQQIKNLPHWTIDWIRHGDTATFEKVQYATTVILQGMFVAGFLVLAWMVWRRFGWGYGLYCFAMLAIALLGTKDFQGTGRYLLSTFPCFLVLAGLLADRPRLRWAWWSASGALLLMWAFAFGRGDYVA
jgi:hypothetical protein